MSYDPAGNLSSKTSIVGANPANGSWTYSYDPLGRMTQARGPNASGVQTTSNYGYDGASDRITVKDGTAAMAITTYDLAGYAVRSDPSTPSVSTDDTLYSHDNIGDLTKVTSPTAGASFTYAYDAFARLVCAKNAAVTSCPSSSSPVTWSLDGLDRATSRTDSTGSTSYVYRGMSQDAVKITAGSVVSTFAMGLSNAIAQKQGSAVRFYLTDAHDDVVGLVDATGAAKGSVSYSPWGSPIATAGTEQAVLGYQGDLTDPSTHQVDMGTRWYDPGLGQFTSRDSVFGNLKDPRSLNQFAYAFDSPVSYTDPTGLNPECHYVDQHLVCYKPPPTMDANSVAEPTTRCDFACQGGGWTPPTPTPTVTAMVCNARGGSCGGGSTSTSAGGSGCGFLGYHCLARDISGAAKTAYHGLEAGADWVGHEVYTHRWALAQLAVVAACLTAVLCATASGAYLALKEYSSFKADGWSWKFARDTAWNVGETMVLNGAGFAGQALYAGYGVRTSMFAWRAIQVAPSLVCALSETCSAPGVPKG